MTKKIKNKIEPSIKPSIKARGPLIALSKRVPPLKIVTERLILKKLDPKMTEVIFSTVDSNRDHLSKFLPWVRYMKTLSDESNWIHLQKEKWLQRSQFVYAIFLAETMTYIGNINAHTFDWSNHSAEIGYWLAKEFEGNGFMTEAVKAVEKALFRIGFHRIVIQCNAKNKRSAKVPARCGFRLEGILRQNAIENGNYRDTMIFAKIAKT